MIEDDLELAEVLSLYLKQFNIEVTNYSISSVSLNGDCLELTISSSGCDPELWEMEMFSTNAFYNIFPFFFNSL